MRPYNECKGGLTPPYNYDFTIVLKINVWLSEGKQLRIHCHFTIVFKINVWLSEGKQLSIVHCQLINHFNHTLAVHDDIHAAAG